MTIDRDPPGAQEQLIRALVLALQQAGQDVQLFETHISWIVIAAGGGDKFSDKFAYKFKKPVHFDFLDFSTLAARLFYCQEELRLNRRLAPALYLDVVPIGGTPSHPVINGDGAAIDYAVKMRAFPQQALWSARIEQGLLSAPEIDALARELAQFHARAARAPAACAWATPAALQKIADDNLALIASLAHGAGRDRGAQQKDIAHIRQWQTRRQARLRSVFAQRKVQGAIRECHGDLHCANILTLDGRVTMFDCIEFNDAFRWIDVMDDLGFICMDLHMHRLPQLAARLLNAYLEISGDYAGLAVLSYYQTERALVRCKVAMLRAAQGKGDDPGDDPGEGQSDAAKEAAALAARYMAFARRSTQATRGALIVMHGLSGCGKSTVSAALLERLGAIRIRSDVERKRMHGMAPDVNAGAPYATGLYDQAATDATYAQLARLVRSVLGAGLPAIVDAAFLRAAQRAQFAALARELEVPFLIVSIEADEAVLRARLAARTLKKDAEAADAVSGGTGGAGGEASDAGPAILTQQLAHAEPLSAAEREYALILDGERGLDGELLAAAFEASFASVCKAVKTE